MSARNLRHGDGVAERNIVCPAVALVLGACTQFEPPPDVDTETGKGESVGDGGW